MSLLTGLVVSGPPSASRERAELAATVRDLLTRHAPVPERVEDGPGGYDADLWKRLRDLGLPWLGVPEAAGGVGGDYLDAHAVLVELGRAVVATPFPATLRAGQAALLAGAAVPDAGSAALVEAPAERVLDGARAEVLLAVLETDDGAVLAELDLDRVHREVLPTMDRSLHLARVEARDATARPLGTLTAADLDRLRALRVVALSAEQVGGARRCLEVTVAYLRERVQFGRPVGSFQAVKHRLADLLVLVEAAESASWTAAAAWTAGAPDAGLLADVAGCVCGEAYLAVAAETVQLHGGIAITWEHPAHRWFKHAHATANLAGSPAAHRARLADRLRTAVRS
ncbi:acyl-CoA dehydrogenase family protein [Spongisporangium articulatum]|uniref:Acyl-CoA dehydrogenase family protein n=1 Tax=Spongisporangium articulatum TaxID=3362603 RepID=A0ABW8ATP7_9ACTN